MNRLILLSALTVSIVIGSAFAALPPRITGLVPESSFGMCMRGEGDQNAARAMAQQIGVKWVRSVQNMDINSPSSNTPATEVTLWNNAGVNVLGSLFYPNNLFRIPGTISPPTDNNAYADNCLTMITKHYAKVKNWEQWNEPWVGEWAWNGGTAEEYRVMIKTIWDKVKAVYPDVNLIGGGSVTFNRDVLYPKGSTTAGYADGSISHAYGYPTPSSFGLHAVQLWLDKTYSKTQGRAGAWQTELGTLPTEFASDGDNWQAKSMVANYVLHILAGAYAQKPMKLFQFAYSTSGFGGDEYNIIGKPAVAVYGIMTQVLEGCACVEDAFPNSRGIWAALYNPTTSTDKRARAVILSEGGWTGSPASCSNEYAGTMSLAGAGIEAYDYKGNTLDPANLTLSPWSPVYILATGTTNQLKAALQQAMVRITTEIKVNPLSLTGKPIANMTLDVQIENMVNAPRSGTLTLTPPNGWTLSQTSLAFADLAPGEVRTLRFPVSTAVGGTTNKYLLGWTLAITGKTGTKTGTQEVQAAFAPKKTITVDGLFTDWDGVPATTMGTSKFRTAWDENNFYVAVQTAGMGAGYADWSTVRNNSTMTVYSANNTNGVWMMLGCAANNPDDVLKGHPLYNKAGRSWADYEFMFNPNATTPEVLRYCAPGTNHQDYYPTTPATNPPLGGMTASEVTYKYTAGGNFEAAFKWSAIPDLKLVVDKLTTANQAAKITLAWRVKGATSGDGQWQDAAGMTENGIYGWSPYWSTGAKCNTPWTFVNGDGSAVPSTRAGSPGTAPRVKTVIRQVGSRLRYVLDKTATVSMRLIDVRGRVVVDAGNLRLNPGSHDIPLTPDRAVGARPSAGAYFALPTVDGRRADVVAVTQIR